MVEEELKNNISKPDIEHNDKRTIIFLLPYSMLVLAGESVALHLVIVKGVSVSFFLFLHFVVIALLTVGTLFFKRNGYDIKIALFVLIQIAFVGPLGAMIGFVSMTLYLFYSMYSSDFSEWLKALFPENEGTSRDALYERIVYGQNKTAERTAVEPFQDIMSYGSTRQKQVAIAKMTRYFQPKFAQVLLQALKDDDNTVRVQAASAIVKIEDGFMKKYKEFEKKVIDDPENLSKLVAFANVCDEYSNSLLLDVDRSIFVREKIIKIYKRCIEYMPGDFNFKIYIGRIYLLNGEPTKAYKYITEVMDSKPILFPGLVMIYMETLFVLRKFKDIRKFVSENIETFKLMFEDKEVFAYMNLWYRGLPELSMRRVGED